MGKYRIEYNRTKCIGAFACVSMDSVNWAMGEDNKADLVAGTKVGTDANGDEIWAKEIEVSDPSVLVSGAQACPVNIIKIIDLKTGKVLAP